jgi:23S rRNA pseudouridine2605 synthase
MRPKKPFKKFTSRSEPPAKIATAEASGTRLNKLLANAGICSRREADELIAMGMVEVNGKVVVEMGYKVQAKDEVRYDGQRILGQKPIYLLMNKPKGFVATSQGGGVKKSVQDLIQSAAPFKVPPMGDMGRPMTGLLFFTNDSKLRAKLNHSKKGIEMVYQLVLDKSIKAEDFKKLQQPHTIFGETLSFSKLAHVQGGTKRELGIEAVNLSPGALRKIVEQHGYKVQQLDRVIWAGLTKKDLPRGRWRHLNMQEINNLQML